MFEIPKDASPTTYSALVEAIVILSNEAAQPWLTELNDTGGTPETDGFTNAIEKYLREKYRLDKTASRDVVDAAASKVSDAAKRLAKAHIEVRGVFNS